MIKACSHLLQKRWLLFASIFCLFTILVPMTLVVKPAQAQSPYDDLYTQLQQLREQLGQLLNSYNALDAKGKAAMDSAMAAGMQQTLRQMYGSMSATDRANLDEEIRRVTGYTETQLIQMCSTIPGAVKAINIMINGALNYSKMSVPPVTSNKPPVTSNKPPVTSNKPPVTTGSSRDITYEKPEQGGVVDFTTPSFNLQLRNLYGASGEQEARAIYDKKVNASKQKLDESNTKSVDRIKEIDEKLKYLNKPPSELEQKVLDFQKNQELEKANQRVNDAWADIVWSLPPLEALSNTKLFVKDIPESLITIKDKWKSGESLNASDWEKIGLASASVILVAAPLVVGAGSLAITIGTGACIASSGIELWSAYSDRNYMQAESKRVEPNVKEYLQQLEQQKKKEQISIDYRTQREMRLASLGFPVPQK